MLRPGLAGLLAFAIVGCGQQEAYIGGLTKVDTWKQAPTNEVDILWVIDNSSSMQNEQAQLAEGFTSFSQALDESMTDFQIGIITTEFTADDPDRGALISDEYAGPIITRDDADYVSAFANRAKVGLKGSGMERGMQAADFALSHLMTAGGGANEGFLRPDANLLVVFVSDEDDCSDEGNLGIPPEQERDRAVECYTRAGMLVPPAEYAARLLELKGSRDRVQVGAIVGPPNSKGLCDENTAVGDRYMDLARFTGGLSVSICDDDWTEALQELGLNATGIFTTFELSSPALEDSLVVTVNGTEVPRDADNGYTYDAAARSITFHGNAVPERDAEIRATYQSTIGGASSSATVDTGAAEDTAP